MHPLAIDSVALLAQEGGHARPAIEGRLQILLVDQAHQARVQGTLARMCSWIWYAQSVHGVCCPTTFRPDKWCTTTTTIPGGNAMGPATVREPPCTLRRASKRDIRYNRVRPSAMHRRSRRLKAAASAAGTGEKSANAVYWSTH